MQNKGNDGTYCLCFITAYGTDGSDDVSTGVTLL